jgi:hypothetical protein
MDKFVQFTEGSGCPANTGLVMDYYDGNTVTALWNYAQHYAMSENDWDTTFGPSTPGALSDKLTNTASVTRFIEDNWLFGKRIGDGSYDAISGSLTGPGGLFDFLAPLNFRPLILDPGTGEVVSG